MGRYHILDAVPESDPGGQYDFPRDDLGDPHETARPLRLSLLRRLRAADPPE